MLSKVKRGIKKVVYSIVPPPVKYIYNSYSQAGEDGILTFLFGDYGLKKISYMDLGTNIPDSYNNTYKFYINGSTGVCVEADTSLIENIKQVRPNDVVINAGVAEKSGGEADFYIFNEPSINTFDEKEAAIRAKSGHFKLLKKEKVPLISINDLIAKHFDTYPDFVSLDIEGLDLMVLKTMNFAKYPVPVICVETCTYSENHVRPKDLSIQEFMLQQDYFIYADTYVNTIFVNKSWFYNKH